MNSESNYEHVPGVGLVELPDPPDNFDLWNSFPEAFRDRVTNKFTAGIVREYDLIRDRVQGEYAVARARQSDRNARKVRQGRR
jgi:hypothetical protein